MFPQDLLQRAFHAANGELAWHREDARAVISLLVRHQQAILGGELWWVQPGSRQWTGLIPQREGGTAFYAWATERSVDEDWVSYVTRCADESNRAIESWPRLLELPDGFQGLILCNLAWAPKA